MNEMNLKQVIEKYQSNLDGYKFDKFRAIEFEIRFDNTNRMTYTTFKNTFDHLTRLGFQVMGSTYDMKITPEFESDDGRVKQSKLRVELDNLNDIKYLCETNELPENKKFVMKSYMNKDIDNPIYNNDYDYRMSIQEEIVLNENKSKIVNDALYNWNRNRKYFRYIHRTSMTHPNHPNIRVDLSKVKSNQKRKTVKFTDANIFNEKEGFEIEIEVINVNMRSDFKSIEQQVRKAIKHVLCGIQNTMFPVKKKDMGMTYRNYFDILEKNSYGYPVTIKKDSKNFIGPSSFTLQKVNLVRDDNSKHVCIQDDFCVTEKADGERKLLFVNGKGKCIQSRQTWILNIWVFRLSTQNYSIQLSTENTFYMISMGHLSTHLPHSIYIFTTIKITVPIHFMIMYQKKAIKTKQRIVMSY